MLRSTKLLEGARLEAQDGHVGQLDDVLFDEHGWKVRWLVAETGHAWVRRKVLLSPLDTTGYDADQHALRLDLSRRQVEQAPPLDSDAPVSRRHELELLQHYGWPVYWVALPPPGPPPVYDSESTTLRSAREVEGYRVHATDGDLGQVAAFLVEEDGWVVRYVVVELHDDGPVRQVQVAPAWLRSVDWSSRRLHVAHCRDGVRHSPVWDPHRTVTRADEAALYEHYGRPFEL